MTELFLVRHGETQWNREGRFQGALDSPLTDRGKSQASALGQRLAKVAAHVERLEVSPLGRTRQTAKLIVELLPGLSACFDAALGEVSLGSWDGLTDVDIDAQWPGRLDGSSPFDWYFRSPDGESYEMAFDRASDWLARQDGAAIVVTHGLFSRVLRGVYLGLPREQALELPVPQDQIWRLADGAIEAIEAA